LLTASVLAAFTLFMAAALLTVAPTQTQQAPAVATAQTAQANG
jgi:hypothetical protein